MDYKRIPELKPVDLDLFRRTASEEVRITVAGLQILLHPLLHRLEKRKPRYLIDSRVSFVCLVGRTRFELVTNGLKVPFHPCHYMSLHVFTEEKRNENRHCMSLG